MSMTDGIEKSLLAFGARHLATQARWSLADTFFQRLIELQHARVSKDEIAVFNLTEIVSLSSASALTLPLFEVLRTPLENALNQLILEILAGWPPILVMRWWARGNALPRSEATAANAG